MCHLAVVCFLMPAFADDPPPRADKYFKITVVDDQTGRGVPLVELETTGGVRYYTDSNGVVAFRELGLMNRDVFFFVRSHGYEFAKDGYGYPGKALETTEGGSATLRIKRVNVAERLYRVTGGGIYADSVLLGEKTPLREPLLNAQVLGSDSVVTAVYKGKLYWFWGDTNRPSYPLGNFNVPGATSLMPDKGGLDPERGLDLSYFVDGKGFARETARMPGDGPTWIFGLFVLNDGKQERMFATYMKVRKQLEVYERGLVEFDDEAKQFKKVTTFDKDAPALPGGQPFLRKDGGVEYVYFGTPFPLVRVRADADAIKKAENYEAFTCLKEGTRLEDGEIDRDGGVPRYAWTKKTPPAGPKELARLVRAGKLKADEVWLPLEDVETGKRVQMHAGSVYWNEHRRRWVMVGVQTGGTSYLGEVWFAEADTPLGPWVYARKVVTHEKYSFYNPKQHAYFDKDGGRIIYFEGTYSDTFSGNPVKTPRYDYNQIMYKLDLADVRLALPVAVYRSGERLGTATRQGTERDPKRVAFFATDRAAKGTIPVYEQAGVLKTGELPKGTEAVFYALPANADVPGAVPLYEYTSADGKKRMYAVENQTELPDWQRAKEPVCKVWRNPSRAFGSEAQPR
jgi:hypothetical protein